MKNILISAVISVLLVLGSYFGYVYYLKNHTKEDYSKIEAQILKEETKLDTPDFSSSIQKREKIILKISHNDSPNSAKGQALAFFEAKLEKMSSKIDVQISGNSESYSDESLTKALKYNTIQMGLVSLDILSYKIPDLSLFGLPFLFKNLSHVHAIQDGDIGLSLLDKVSNEDYIAMKYWDNQFKHLISNTKIEKFSDLHSLRVNVKDSEILKKHYFKLNAKPITFEESQLNNGIDNKMLDAQEITLSDIFNKEFHKKQKYLTLTKHGYEGDIVLISKAFWNDLSSELKYKIKEALKLSTKLERQLSESLNSDNYNKLVSYDNNLSNFTILRMTSKNKADWLNEVKGLFSEYSGLIGKDNLQRTFIEAANH